MSQRVGYSRAYKTNYDLIDWSDFKPSVTVKVDGAGKSGGPMFIPDIKPFVSPITGKEISSRSRLREHNKAHGVFQVGNDLKPHEYTSRAPSRLNERAFDRAFDIALQKTGLK